MSQHRCVTEEALERTRFNLGMTPGSVINPAELHLDPVMHSIVAADGSRWSNWAAKYDRDDYSRYVARQEKSFAAAAALFAGNGFHPNIL